MWTVGDSLVCRRLRCLVVICCCLCCLEADHAAPLDTLKSQRWYGGFRLERGSGVAPQQQRQLDGQEPRPHRTHVGFRGNPFSRQKRHHFAAPPVISSETELSVREYCVTAVPDKYKIRLSNTYNLYGCFKSKNCVHAGTSAVQCSPMCGVGVGG